jgi:hypothetical protein
MKYLVITRSLQSDFDWEHDAENIATIFMDLLKIKFPAHNKYYPKVFVTYFTRHIADSVESVNEPIEKTREKLADLIEGIELIGFEETKRFAEDKDAVQYFKFNYEDKDLDLMQHLLETTTAEYYKNVKPELIDKVEFLKQDYGNDLVFVNSTSFYGHLLNTFYDHNCPIVHTNFNEKEDIVDELTENKVIDNNFEVVYT